MGSWQFDLDFLVVPAKAQGAAAEKTGSSDGEVREEEEGEEEEEEGSMGSEWINLPFLRGWGGGVRSKEGGIYGEFPAPTT